MPKNRLTKRTGKGAIAVAVATLAVGSTVVFAITTASAGPKPPPPPAPTITSGPAGTSTSKSATFTYTSSRPDVSFKCSLDGAAFTPCAATGITYTDLSDGTHTFRVAAQAPGSSLGPAAARTWTVDTKAPAITVTFPADGGSYRSSSWNAGCAPAGICGTASDPRGISSVRVAVFQHDSGRYWNGAAFASTDEVFNPASGASAWKYALAIPADGRYSVHVRATDGAGNTTSAAKQATRTFTVDTVAPAPPAIDGAPDDPTSNDNAQFSFDGDEPSLAFACSLDGGPSSSCGGTASYSQLDVGEHCFEVVARDPAGNQSDPTSYCWTVLVDKEFEVTGSTDLNFYPGRTQAMNLVIGNPFNFDLEVLSVSIVVADETTKGGAPNDECIGSENLVITRELDGPVVVPRNATKSLQQLGIPESRWPLLHMPDLPVNQDGCKSTTFKLTYTGVGTKP